MRSCKIFHTNISSLHYALDNKMSYQNTYCNCAKRYAMADWCQKWSVHISDPFCVLNGGAHSKFCPGAEQLIWDGKKVDHYISSNPSICNKTAGELKIVTFLCLFVLSRWYPLERGKFCIWVLFGLKIGVIYRNLSNIYYLLYRDFLWVF